MSAVVPIYEASRLLPSDSDIEQAVLGAVLLEVGGITEVGDFLRPEAFYVDAHARIWNAILSLYRKRSPIDILTVTMALKSLGSLDQVGGAFYISQLTNKVSGTSNLQYHARLLVQLHMRREQIRIGQALMERGYSDLSDVFDSLAYASSDIRVLNDFGSTEAMPMSQIVPQVLERDVKDRGVRFGFDTLDRKIRLEPGTVNIIGARPGMGKTSFMLSSAWRQAQLGHRPYVVELEMSNRNLARRLVCGETGVEIWKAKRGYLSEQEMDLMAQWHISQGDAQNRIVIDESASMTVSALAARLDRAKRKQSIDVVWIDYIGLLQPSTRQRPGYDRMTAISNELRVLAKEIDLPFAALAQLSRPPKTLSKEAPPPPRLTDLRDSGELEQDAESVCFLHRPKYYDSTAGDEVQFIIAKYRDGSDGMEELLFDANGIRILDKPLDIPAFNVHQGISPNNRIEPNRNSDEPPF